MTGPTPAAVYRQYAATAHDAGSADAAAQKIADDVSSDGICAKAERDGIQHLPKAFTDKLTPVGKSALQQALSLPQTLPKFLSRLLDNKTEPDSAARGVTADQYATLPSQQRSLLFKKIAQASAGAQSEFASRCVLPLATDRTQTAAVVQTLAKIGDHAVIRQFAQTSVSGLDAPARGQLISALLRGEITPQDRDTVLQLTDCLTNQVDLTPLCVSVMSSLSASDIDALKPRDFPGGPNAILILVANKIIGNNPIDDATRARLQHFGSGVLPL